MTTTPTANPELLDLDKLEALAKAAQISILRMGMNGRPNDYFALMNAMSPESVLALIALARSAQPYATGGMVPGGLYLASEGSQPLHTQPEREARQVAAHRAVIEEAAQVLDSAAAHNRSKGRTVLERTQQDRADRLRAVLAKPAASLSPLCGAQHAESDANWNSAINAVADELESKSNLTFISQFTALCEEFDRRGAALAAQSQGAPALPNGWQVEPVGDAMHIKRADGKWCGYMAENGPAAALTFEFLRDLAAQQAAAPGAQVDRWSWSKRGMELEPNGYYATYSAPGTPEAPKGGA